MNLSNIPTPLTDAAVAKSGFMGEEKVTADFSRRLERERHVLIAALRPFAAMHRDESSYPDDHVIALRGVASDLTMITEGDFRDAHKALTLTAPTES